MSAAKGEVTKCQDCPETKIQAKGRCARCYMRWYRGLDPSPEHQRAAYGEKMPLLTVSVEEEQHKMLTREAKRLGQSVSQVTRDALRLYFSSSRRDPSTGRWAPRA